MTQGIDHRAVEWDPVPEGTIRTLADEADDGTRYEVLLQWADGEWRHLLGVRVGTACTGSYAGSFRGGDKSPAGAGELPPMDPRILSRIGADLEAFLVDYATTQRFAMVWRDIDDGALDAGEAPTVLGGQRFDMLRNREGAHSDVALAASLYRFFGAIGSRRPTDDVATATRVSRATAARRIRDARAEGLLGEARRGVAGERGTRGRP